MDRDLHGCLVFRCPRPRSGAHPRRSRWLGLSAPAGRRRGRRDPRHLRASAELGDRHLALPVHDRRRSNLLRRVEPPHTEPLVLVVGGRQFRDPVRGLVPGPAQRADQQLVWQLLRLDTEGACHAEQCHTSGILRADMDLPRYRDGVHHRRRSQQFPREPLHLPMADGDERLLRRKLAEAPRYRGRFATCPGGYDALRLDGRESRVSALSTR